MNSYRIYGLDPQGRIVFGDYVDCADDTAAIDQARALLDRFAGAEVWLGNRHVAGPAAIRRERT